MTTENIEEIAAQVSAKTGFRLIWYFGGMLLAIAALYFGLKADIAEVKSTQEMRKIEVNDQLIMINNNLENVKNSVSDLKDQTSDLKNTVDYNDKSERKYRKSRH